MDSSSNIKQDIIQKYISQTLETGASPTVSQICRDLQIPEKEFFKNFPNIEAVEAEHWWNVMDHNIRCCENSSEWSNYNAQQRLLAFYFQYFDDALEHRSLLLIRFSDRRLTDVVPVFNRAMTRFREFVCSILNHALREKQIADRGRINDLYAPAFVLQFRSILDFHLKDESAGFENTDAFIEKSVRLSFDLMRTSALESAFDLAKWVFTQRQNPRTEGSVKSSSCGV
jgi:hypothetical protein